MKSVPLVLENSPMLFDPSHLYNRRISSGTRVRKASCPGVAVPFASDDELLEAAIQLFRARREVVEADRNAERDDKQRRVLRGEEAAWSRYWHRSFGLSGSSTAICRCCKRHRLRKAEREILVALVLDRLALLEGSIHSCGDVLEVLSLPGNKVLDALRLISEHGRLFRAGLISYDDPDEDLAQRTPLVDPVLVDSILAGKGCAEAGWEVTAENELYDRLQVLSRALLKKSEAMRLVSHGMNTTSDVFKWTRKADRLLSSLDETLNRHRSWKLAELRQSQFSAQPDWTVFLALLGKELGHLSVDESLFSGGGLARAASRNVDSVRTGFQALASDRELVRKGLVQPCGGAIELASDDPADLEETEFELTEKAIELLGLDKKTRRKRSSEFRARKATVAMKYLVLSNNVRRALDMALVQCKHGKTMIDDWGLGELIPYGRGTVLLFSGPPGTGKTATAEALAGQLGKLILVADYSRIQNCFVGQTEKNIVRAFREAKSQDAVLFWDEADAMFFDRDSAHRNWEVRDVNVLLQELERFDGVCVLATNRKITLDKALQRRITLKVEFDRPDRKQQRQIWRKLLPKRMPLARDVDLNELSEADFVGGEIKNAVLNAARLAMQRNGRGPVTMSDFRQAVALERDGGWNESGNSKIGFSG
jgi:hypothetical protein